MARSLDRSGQRVKITGGMKEFVGKMGLITHKEDKLYRVKLDEPVEIPGVGEVYDDLWETQYLTQILPPRPAKGVKMTAPVAPVKRAAKPNGSKAPVKAAPVKAAPAKPKAEPKPRPKGVGWLLHPTRDNRSLPRGRHGSYDRGRAR
jgi:hypothetical protein